MIIYFTGTGNSRDVAHRLARLLNETTIVELREPLLSTPQLAVSDGERVVWVFPVYSWGVPPVVERFIRDVKVTGNAEKAAHYLVITCGDDVGMTDRQWRRLIEARGWQPRSAASVTMPNTYVLMKGFDVDSKELELSKLQASVARVEHVARMIETGMSGADVVRGTFPRFKSGIIRPWFVRYAMSPKPFHATEACVGCGKCSASCPMENIRMVDGKPSWSNNCALCLRCYHICPTHAVAYGKATKGKGQYINYELRATNYEPSGR